DLSAQGMPLVLCDRVTDVASASTVEIDDFIGGYLATTHLLEQGYRRIVHFAGSTNLRIYAERKRGYQQALKDWGIPIIPDLILESQVLLEDGFHQMHALLDEGVEFDAVFSSSDYAAMGAMQVCKQRGIVVPDQLGIVGFANESFAEFTQPQLSSVEQRSTKIGEQAANLILEVLEVGISKIKPRHIVLKPELIIRDSSQKNSH
ncbi:MAG: substrate-binding domain-containing protein, partial [Bacteroidota bacterium]